MKIEVDVVQFFPKENLRLQREAIYYEEAVYAIDQAPVVCRCCYVAARPGRVDVEAKDSNWPAGREHSCSAL